MTSRSGSAGPTTSKLNDHIKVDGVPTSLHQNEEHEGMTTTTADSTFSITEEATLTKIKTQDEQPNALTCTLTSLEEDTMGLPYHQVNLTKGKEIMLKNGNVPNVARMEKENNHPITFKEMAEDAIGRPCHDILFMTGKEIRDKGDLLAHDAYINMRTKTLGPESLNYVPRKREIVKAAMKWKAPAYPTTDEDELQGSTTGGPKEFKFSVNPYQSQYSGNKQKGGAVFLFGKAEGELLRRNRNHIPRVAMLVLGGTLRHNPKSHKDLAVWDRLSGSVGTLFQSQGR